MSVAACCFGIPVIIVSIFSDIVSCKWREKREANEEERNESWERKKHILAMALMGAGLFLMGVGFAFTINSKDFLFHIFLLGAGLAMFLAPLLVPESTKPRYRFPFP